MSERSSLLREGALWGAAAAIVLAAHMGGSLWVLHMARAATPPGLPDPIFVDLEDMPQAAAALDEVDQPDTEQAEPEPEPEPQPEPEDIALPEPLQELEPLPDMNSLFPPPPDAVVLKKSVRPKERPEPEPDPQPGPEPKVVEKRREPTPQKPLQEQPARQASTRVRAPQAERTAAPQAQVGSPSPRQVASWQSKVNAAVARHMQRARLTSARGQSVTVTVQFSVDPSGRVAGARLASSTGNAGIDSALSRQASRMPRMPPPPAGKTVALVLPVKILMR